MSARRCGNVARHCGSSSCDPQLVTSTQLAFCARPPSSNHSPLPSFEAVLHSIHQVCRRLPPIRRPPSRRLTPPASLLLMAASSSSFVSDLPYGPF
ncbi:uncharacterized protein PGTG_16101 [Puccinia graminis f. sp. tritici CRL 75-36-700-3]|uniref:Uncharacterized protein n=1 Tax=Puccinia graminis f. sp. tritici (strain CRL 75-36-700-3 / race SCCL) TaxID=418459 RepID=E3L1T9_PUCGT|nr:uncharacterized protein PGTG_16101 [Puccinia graminis f. sp. tritici CRL 75-36-700-3]EFP90514.2 hypothetical protein PGTG_16101 [Puccinia graminis f. sp. tritici CRL 75-36-700-3]